MTEASTQDAAGTEVVLPEDAAKQGEEQKSVKKEEAASQEAVKEERNALKERRTVVEAAKGHFEEGSTMWISSEASIKELDAEIEKKATPQQKPQPENAYMKCVKQLRI